MTWALPSSPSGSKCPPSSFLHHVYSEFLPQVKSLLLELIDHVIHSVVVDGLPCLSSFLHIHCVSKGNLALLIPFFVIKILEQNLINKGVSKLQNQADVCTKKTMVTIPVVIVQRALPLLCWKKPLPIEDKKFNPVCLFSATISSLVMISEPRSSSV